MVNLLGLYRFMARKFRPDRKISAVSILSFSSRTTHWLSCYLGGLSFPASACLCGPDIPLPWPLEILSKIPILLVMVLLLTGLSKLIAKLMSLLTGTPVKRSGRIVEGPTFLLFLLPFLTAIGLALPLTGLALVSPTDWGVSQASVGDAGFQALIGFFHVSNAVLLLWFALLRPALWRRIGLLPKLTAGERDKFPVAAAILGATAFSVLAVWGVGLATRDLLFAFNALINEPSLALSLYIVGCLGAGELGLWISRRRQRRAASRERSAS